MNASSRLVFAETPRTMGDKVSDFASSVGWHEAANNAQ